MGKRARNPSQKALMEQEDMVKGIAQRGLKGIQGSHGEQTKKTSGEEGSNGTANLKFPKAKEARSIPPQLTATASTSTIGGNSPRKMMVIQVFLHLWGKTKLKLELWEKAKDCVYGMRLCKLHIIRGRAHFRLLEGSPGLMK